MSDYLWDKQGEPDPEVERLETLLASFRHRPLPLPGPLPAARPRARRLYVSMAVAAAAVIALIAMRAWRPRPVPREDGHALASQGELPIGTWIDSGAGRVTLRLDGLGTVELGPATRARIVASQRDRHELELARGTLAAKIVAPPRAFVVRAGRLTVTDLGCAFILTVDERGRGRLVVSEGRVAVASGAGAEVVVPAGAESELGPDGASPPRTVEAPPPPRALDAPPPAPRPSRERAPKRHPHTQSTRAISRPAAPARQTAPTRKTAPARPTQPKTVEPPHLTHDPLKDLERSGE